MDSGMEEYIKQLLQTYTRRELSLPPGRRLAAVLLPLYQHNGDYGVIFTQRSDTVYHHRGQISFPGGGHEVHDVSLQHTALRESAEEIGLQPAHVQVLGQLDDLLTTGSKARPCCYLGDYEGMARLPHGLAAAFSMGKPIARHQVDMYFTRITTSR